MQPTDLDSSQHSSLYLGGSRVLLINPLLSHLVQGGSRTSLGITTYYFLIRGVYFSANLNVDGNLICQLPWPKIATSQLMFGWEQNSKRLLNILTITIF